MHRSIFNKCTPMEAMNSRFCDMLGHMTDLRNRRTLKAHGDMTTEEVRTRAIEMYSSIVNSVTANRGDRMRAQERLDKLYGLEAQAVSGVTGEALLAVLANAQATLGAAPPASSAESAQNAPTQAEDASSS